MFCRPAIMMIMPPPANHRDMMMMPGSANFSLPSQSKCLPGVPAISLSFVPNQLP